MLDIRLLGVLAVTRDGRHVDLGGPKQRAALAVLALDTGHVVSTDRLIEGLWGSAPPPSALNTVQVYISRLRKALGEDVIELHRTGYRLCVASGELDLHRFERGWRGGVDAIEADHGDEAIQLISQALSEWHGDPLQEFLYDEFAATDIARLAEMRLHALEDLFEARLRAGRGADLVPELDPLVRANPTRERLRGALMLALYRAGRHADALSAYRDFREKLADQLGIDPSPALSQLERRILNHDPTLVPAGASVAADPAAAVNPVTALAMRRSLLVVDVTDAVDWLADVALSLCGGAPDHEIVATQLLPTQQAARLADVTGRLASLRARVSSSGGQIRVAAFTSSDPAADAARMAAQEDIELVLCDGRATLRGEASRAGVPDQLIADAPCDAGLVVVPVTRPRSTRAAALWCRSAAQSTIGPRLNWEPGSPPRVVHRSAWPASCPLTPGGTRADCSPMRRSVCSAPVESSPSPS